MTRYRPWAVSKAVHYASHNLFGKGITMRGCGILKLRSRLFWLFVTTWMAVISAPAKAVPGDIYVSRCCGTEEIDRVTPDGSRTVFAATGLQSPMDLAFDRSGNLFVANYGSNSIEKFTPSGVDTVFANTGLNGPSNLAFDGAGNLFVSIGGDNTILKFNPSGVGSVFASTGLSNPQGLAFDRFGSLFVANNGDNTIRRFTPAGAGSVFASSVFSGCFGRCRIRGFSTPCSVPTFPRSS